MQLMGLEMISPSPFQVQMCAHYEFTCFLWLWLSLFGTANGCWLLGDCQLLWEDDDQFLTWCHKRSMSLILAFILPYSSVPCCSCSELFICLNFSFCFLQWKCLFSCTWNGIWYKQTIILEPVSEYISVGDSYDPLIERCSQWWQKILGTICF